MSKRLEELVGNIDNLSEDKVRQYFAEILASYAQVGTGNHTGEDVLEHVKSIYRDVTIRPVMNKALSND